jgi:hypothetical protein
MSTGSCRPPSHVEADAAATTSEEALIARARYSDEFIEPAKRKLVLGVLRDRWRDGEWIVTEDAILREANYTVDAWWQGWLHDGVTHLKLAQLAEALASSAEVFRQWNWALNWMADPAPDEPIPPMRAVCSEPEPLSRDAVARLLDHPDLAFEGASAGLLPRSLREYLGTKVKRRGRPPGSAEQLKRGAQWLQQVGWQPGDPITKRMASAARVSVETLRRASRSTKK